jgi:osmoprotectant transport system ATP-binding protein
MAKARQMTNEGGVALALSAISKKYDAIVALDNVSLDVAPGEWVAIVGESGSGKTTLLRTINRLVEPDSGSVSVNGTDVRNLDVFELRRSIGYVPQDGGLMPHWRVARNVALVPALSRMPDAGERAIEALRTVGFDPGEIASRWPHELSGGQRQRVAMARALAASPSCMLLDEPFGALDAITRSELQQAFRRIRDAAAFTSVLVTHDLREAFFLADRIAVMRSGRIEQVAPPGELRELPATPYVVRLLEHAEMTAA